MNTKHLLATISLSFAVVPALHAADAPGLDRQDADKPVIVAEAKSMPVVSAPVSPAVGKTREQVVAEFMEGVKDGSYVAPSEIYPMMTVGGTRR